jgi:hypothetical protein
VHFFQYLASPNNFILFKKGVLIWLTAWRIAFIHKFTGLEHSFHHLLFGDTVLMHRYKRRRMVGAILSHKIGRRFHEIKAGAVGILMA